MKILKILDHDNVISIQDSLIKENCLFMELEFMDFNLKEVLVNKKGGLSSDHIKYIFYQMVLGVAYLHAQGVEHLELRPKHVLVSNDCDVKISGFKKSKPTFLPKEDDPNSVKQNYYTSPEIILNNGRTLHCAFKSDIWSLGCMFFELLEKKHLFDYKRHYLDQLFWIFKLLGSPNRNSSHWIKNSDAKQFVEKLGKHPVKLASSYIGQGNACPLAKDLLDKMLRSFKP